MSDHLTPERLAEIRERAKLQCGLDGEDVDDLLVEVDRLHALRADLEDAVANHARGISGDIYSIVHILDRDIRRGQQ